MGIMPPSHWTPELRARVRMRPACNVGGLHHYITAPRSSIRGRYNTINSTRDCKGMLFLMIQTPILEFQVANFRAWGTTGAPDAQLELGVLTSGHCSLSVAQLHSLASLLQEARTSKNNPENPKPLKS